MVAESGRKTAVPHRIESPAHLFAHAQSYCVIKPLMTRTGALP